MLFNSQFYRALVHLKAPKFYPLLSLPFSLKLGFCTSTSESESETESHSFTVSYLINNIGLPPETAVKASKRLRFKSSEKPDSVLTFFRDRGFSDSNIRDIVRREPWLISTDPHKTILPKFEFFLSKGASASDIARLLTANPRILQKSLEKRIIPVYELVNRFLQSDKNTIACIIRNSISFSYTLSIDNLKLLIDCGVCDLSIARLLVTRPSLLGSNDLLKTVEEVKGLGFDPSKSTFAVAMTAKKAVSKARWDDKVDILKKWGWSDETVLQAFRRQPNLMLVSCDKINLVMSFCVNQLGWDALALVKKPGFFGYSLEKRMVPRALVLQNLLAKGLRKKNASLFTPFTIPEKLFLEKYVKCFKEEKYQLLKLYQGKKRVFKKTGTMVQCSI
ncbi:uncharacterized protein LOC133287522 [Gastrolobium bilobum]|uniref:uncharacterized protein LOC133287522 n=1 Tax=Gastrolobium bilobum TaxID=150636 RepID=UPI002AAFE3C8|nr:uncharacterized protein LOC133287522 [Gastrolobium bilobum]XP_061341135.1 uncharacterized protein LOC133287522 [Gastrolobium bilobum]